MLIFSTSSASFLQMLALPYPLWPGLPPPRLRCCFVELFGFTGTFEGGVDEPKNPSLAVRSWYRNLLLREVIS